MRHGDIVSADHAIWNATETDPLTPLLLDTHVWLWMLDGTAGALSKGVRAVVERAAAAQRLFVSDISYWEVAMLLVHSTRLPGEPHGDPADRILLAHAQALGASRMTCDRGIVDYAVRTAGIPVCDARG